MQKFGIEIRKVGNVTNLYRDVDTVLRKNDIQQGGVSRSVQVATVAHALQKMIKADQWFNVCVVRDCIKVCQVVISRDRMDIYQAAHCIHWNEMTPEYRDVLMAMVLDDFRTVLNSGE